MKEYIAREALITAACERCNGEYVPCDKSYCLLMEVIHSIPAADVREVVMGKWIRCGDGENVPYMCSHCGKTSPANLIEKWGADFCPNCGAEMEADDE